MANSDGSVEIRITGSVDPSVAAAAGEAKASLDGLGASAAGLRPGFDASAASLKQLIGQTGSFAAAQKALAAANGDMGAALLATTAAEEVNTAATTVNTGAAVNNKAAYESLVLVHEALQGRFSRLAGSSLILTQYLAGQSAVTSAVAFATSAAGIAIIGSVAAIGLATAATISYESAEKKLITTSVGLGAQSGLTAQQLKQIGESADSSSQSIRETTKAAEAFAASGVKDEATIKQASISVEAFSQLVGEKFVEAQKTLAEAMKDPVKGAKDLHDELGILSGDQLEQIQRLTDLGEKDQAVAVLMQALKQRIDEARDAGVGMRGETGTLIDVLSNLYTEIGQVIEGWGAEAGVLLERLIPALHQAAQAHRDVANAAQQQAQNEAQLNAITGKGADLWAATPEGQAAKRYQELAGDVKAAKDALTVDTATLGEHALATQRAKQTLDDYEHALSTYIPEYQKKAKADQLEIELAKAKHTHNKQLVTDLTQQIALIKEAGVVESDATAKSNATGAGDVAGAKTFAPKGGKGPSIVSEWEEQLHEAEVTSDDFFQDQTSKELAFWQSKVALTKTGSKEWLDVQSKIYDASKTLAHQDYDEHIADLNAKLEADRDDWKQEQADWAEKLAFIKSKYGEQSTQYKDAFREEEAAEREHENQMIQAMLSGNTKEISALKAHLSAMKQLRQDDATAAEETIKEQANGQILGEVTAATRIGQIHQQLIAQEIADATTVFQKEDALRKQALAQMEADAKTETETYKNAKKQEAADEQAFQDQIKQLEAKGMAQQIQDINAVKTAYHSYLDSLVSSTTSAFTGLLSGTETWQQAMSSIFNSLLSTIDQILSRIISNWIVNMIVGQTTQQATALAQISSYAGVAGAAGIASFAAAPWPIDLGAPAFGAAMSSAALAFNALAAAPKLATGTNYLPSDMLIQAHQGERILPKADNQKLMDALNVAGNDNSSSFSSGNIHIHLHSVMPPKPHELRQFFEDNHQAVGAGVRKYWRQGGSTAKFK